MLSLFTGGFQALVQGAMRCLRMGTRVALGTYVFGALFWLAVGVVTMPVRDLLLAPQSPLVWFLCLGIFLGTRPELGRYFDIIAGVFAWLLIPPMFYSLAKLRSYGRFDGDNPQVIYLSLTLWFAAYHLLGTPGRSRLQRVVRSLPLAACCLVAVFNQGRGWLVLGILGFSLMVARPLFLEKGMRAVMEVLKDAGLVLIALVGVGFAAHYFYPLAVEGLLSRLTHDSRSEQYRTFFAQVDALSLLTGKGPEAAFRFETDSSYGFFDNQFLWMLFKGGAVICLGYVILALLPGFRLFWRARDEREYAAGGTIILWSLGLAGFSTFLNVSLSAQNYFMILLGGFCHARLLNTQRPPVESRSRPPLIWKSFSSRSQPRVSDGRVSPRNPYRHG